MTAAERLVAIALLAGIACAALGVATRPARSQGDQWQLLLNRAPAAAPAKRKAIRGYIRRKKKAPAIVAPRRSPATFARAPAPGSAALPISPMEVRTIRIVPPHVMPRHAGAFALRSPADDPAPDEDMRPPTAPVPSPLLPLRERPAVKTAAALAMVAALIFSVLYPINGRA